jgi:O-antigen ligase
MNDFRLLQSPALPALFLLFGLIFGFAIAHIAGLTWMPAITRAFYAIALLWGAVLTFQRRASLRQIAMNDWLFLVFLLLVIVSLILHQDKNDPSAAYYAKLLPFLVLLPYCLGRLMQRRDRALFERSLPWLGILLLLLCVLDYWWAPDNEVVHSRWRFFGIDHSPLLIATLLSVATLASAHFVLHRDYGRREKAAPWIVISIFSMALVLISARGALIACSIVLILLMFLMHHIPWRRRVALFCCFTLSVGAAFYVLPKPQSDFYARMTYSDEFPFLSSKLPEHAELIAKIKINPKCKAIVEGVNSVAIRRLLYAEAIELSVQNPLSGVGATRFGNYSCGGPGTYPHNTILQSFAELGMLGGIVLLALLAVSFSIALRVYFSDMGGGGAIWIALLVFFSLADQIYGNYFMSSGSFFLFGVAASLRFPDSMST